jgi:transcriptional regulator with XRE-family HTH domain
MSDGVSPTVQRRRLRAELRRIRLETKQTQEQVATAIDWSLSKFIRIENESVGISTSELKVLLDHSGIVDDRRLEELIALARAARERSWWSAYRDFAPQLLQSIEHRAAPMITRNFEPLLISGLLQTEGPLGLPSPGPASRTLPYLAMDKGELRQCPTQPTRRKHVTFTSFG